MFIKFNSFSFKGIKSFLKSNSFKFLLSLLFSAASIIISLYELVVELLHLSFAKTFNGTNEVDKIGLLKRAIEFYISVALFYFKAHFYKSLCNQHLKCIYY